MDLSNAYGDAGDCYQKCRKHQGKRSSLCELLVNHHMCHTDAADVYEKSARILAENGKFVKAAETLIELVNVLEKDTKLKQALVHLEKAASYFEGENKDNTAKQLRERMALMNASAEYYDDAIEYWEERAETIINATNGMESKLKAKEYLFKAGLCQLAQVKDIEEDLEMAKDKIEEYREMDRWLVKAAEGQFLLEAVNAFEQKSIPMYQQAMRKYDDKNSVDLWTTNILDTIFSNFKSALDEEFDLT